jgi:hypothetical protein
MAEVSRAETRQLLLMAEVSRVGTRQLLLMAEVSRAETRQLLPGRPRSKPDWDQSTVLLP